MQTNIFCLNIDIFLFLSEIIGVLKVLEYQAVSYLFNLRIVATHTHIVFLKQNVGFFRKLVIVQMQNIIYKVSLSPFNILPFGHCYKFSI